VRRTALVLLVAALTAGCARPKPRVSSPGLPAGDAVWFEDGVGTDSDKIEEALVRGGISTVFIPGARLSREGARWQSQALTPPGRPFARVRSILVVDADSAFGDALGRREAIGPLADAVWLAIKNVFRDTRRYGPVAGVHLDLPFTAASVESYGALLSSVRARLPLPMLLSVSLRFSPTSPEQKEKMKSLAACDGVLAFVFGEDNSSDPLTVDSLEFPWWAGYSATARGVWQDAAGETRRIPEWILAQLSDDPRVDFLQNVSLKEESGQTFLLRPRVPISLGEQYSLRAGDRLSFRQPLVSDMLFRMRSDVAGRRLARGRVVALPGRSESERLFTLAALVDVLTGRPAKPDLHVAVETARTSVTVSAENLSPHASVLSRTSNWVEIQIPTGGIRDVQPGGFDRFEVYDADRRPVTMALATTVRFYETLIEPFEKIQPARILVGRPLSKGCCESRHHFIAASGQEVLSDALTATPASH
jgi:hypothetical protein